MFHDKRFSLFAGTCLAVALALAAGIWLSRSHAGASPGEKDRQVRRETERESNRQSGVRREPESQERRESERERNREIDERRERELQERRDTERKRNREFGERRERELQERREADERAERGERERRERREHLEMERGELELRLQRTEAVIRIAEICKDEVRSAAYAVTHITDFCEPKEAIEKLEFLAGKTTNDAVRRVIRIRLAELYAHTERPQESLKQLERLVTGK